MARSKNRRRQPDHQHQHQDVTTASVVRIGIFQPTRRPTVKTWRVETRWGTATITGRLGQQHADFMECCRAVAESQGLDGAGRFCCIVDPNKLRTAMSEGRARVAWAQMLDLAEELRACKVSDLHITSRPSFGVVSSGIFDSVLLKGVEQVPTTRKGTRLEGVGVVGGRAGRGGVVVRTGRSAKVGEGRELWKVAFSEAWTSLMGADMPISYRGRLLNIIALRHGVNQAIARFMLSHAPGATYDLDTVLRIVGVGLGVLHHRRRDVQEEVEGLASAGVCVTGDVISTVGPNLNPGGPNLNPGGPNLNPGGPNLNPGSYRLIGP